jgi:hypothetical protein
LISGTLQPGVGAVAEADAAAEVEVDVAAEAGVDAESDIWLSFRMAAGKLSSFIFEMCYQHDNMRHDRV